MFSARSKYLLFAFGVALLSAGCMDSQKDQANADCGLNYVGRQKSACELGVASAFDIARKDDGMSRSQKYKIAMSRCQKLEKPLVKPCTTGVSNFRTELAKIEPATRSSKGRMPASN